MNIAPKSRLSLRKLFTAMMAVGPLAVLPSPVWAVLPSYTAPGTATNSFTVNAGSATVGTSGSVANISASDKAVLQWGLGNFTLGLGETWNFVLPSGGAVLNRVGNATATVPFTDTATITGTLLSNGRVIVLANGGIVVSTGATINTAGGLILSTLREDSDGPFSALGNLTLSGISTGTISVGAASFSGNLTAAAGAITNAGSTVTGDLVLRSITAGSGINLSASATQRVDGNLSVTTNAGAITGTNPVTVGIVTAGNQTTTLSTGAGGVPVTLSTAGSDFEDLFITAPGAAGDVTLNDANSLRFGASTVGNDLTLTLGGLAGTAAVATTGTLSVGRNLAITQITTADSGVDIRNDSMVGAVISTGTLSVNTTNGAVRFNGAGNLTTGVITTNTVAPGLTPATTTLSATGAVTAIALPANNTNIIWQDAPTVTLSLPPLGGTQATAAAVVDGSVITGFIITNAGLGYSALTPPTATFSGGARRYGSGSINITTSGALNITGAVSSSNNSSSPAANFSAASVNHSVGTMAVSGVVTINSTAGNITLGTMTSNRVSINAASGYNINQTAGSLITVGSLDTGNTTRSSTFNAPNGNITLDQLNPFNANAALNLTGNTVSVTGINNITLGSSNVTGNLSVTTAAGKNIIIGNGLGTAAQNVNVRGTMNLTTSTTGTITDNIYSTYDVLNGMNLVTGSGAVTLNNAVTLLDLGSDPVRTSYGAVNVTTTGAVTLTETTGLNLGNINGGGALLSASLVARSTTGPIVDSGNLSITGTANFRTANVAAGTITLDGLLHNIGTVEVYGGIDSNILVNSNVILGTGTYASGNFTLTTNPGRNITAGVFAGANLYNPGNLNLVSGGTITFAGNVSVGGNLSMTANNSAAVGQTVPVSFNRTASITRDTDILSSTYGNISALTVTPGNIMYSTAPLATLTGAGTLTAGTTTSAITASTTLAADGTIASVNVIYGVGVPTAPMTGLSSYSGNPTVTLNGGTVNAAIGQSGGSLEVTGTTSIGSGATLWGANNFSNVVLNNPGAQVIVNDVNNLTASGNSTGRAMFIAGGNSSATPFPSSRLNGSPADDWSLVLGNLNVNSLIATAANSGGGNSGTLTQQSGTTVRTEGLSAFTTRNNNIVVGNNGNNFGRVEINVSDTDGSRTVTLVEDGTMKLGNLSSRGSTSLTSRFGSIIEDPVLNSTITNNGTLTLAAANGSINIGGTTRTSGVTTGNLTAVVATAPSGSVAVFSTGDLALGNITALSLAVQGRALSQTGVLRIFGPASFLASRAITLENEGNNFGRVSLTTTEVNRNISIVEAGTLNLGTVAMGSPGAATYTVAPTVYPATNAVTGNGTFTARSVGGDIIDTGLGGVKLGGLIAPSYALNANAVLSGTGLVTLSAVNGNIELNDPTTDFQTTGGLVFTANNVTLSPLGNAPIWLGATGSTTSATGNLTVTSAIGNINNNGPLTVGGDAFFQSGNGDIIMTNGGNNFGTVRFAGRVVSITEAGNLTLATGSSATGIATFTSTAGDITIANRGGTISLAQTALFSASGNITLPKLIQAAGTVTVSAVGTKDLSALSVAGDLGGRAPQNFGSGTYLPPGP